MVDLRQGLRVIVLRKGNGEEEEEKAQEEEEGVRENFSRRQAAPL